MSRTFAAARHQRGYTLIEVVVAFALLAFSSRCALCAFCTGCGVRGGSHRLLGAGGAGLSRR